MDYTLKLNGIVVNQVFVVGEHDYGVHTVPTPVVTSEDYYLTCTDGITTITAGYQVTVTCSDQNATIYTRYVDGYFDEGLQEIVWNSDINQMPWNQSSDFVLYSDANGVTYLLQAKATRSGYNDSVIDETEIIPPYEECPPDIDCTDCNNWAECGYASYEDCDCQVNLNCPEQDYCQECIDACAGDPDCEASCWECDMPCGEPCDTCADWENQGYGCYEECNGEPCEEETDCSDCNNWSECGYGSYEDCDCQLNGNCPEEEQEPEE